MLINSTKRVANNLSEMCHLSKSSGANHESVIDESPFPCAAPENGSSICQISASAPLLLHRRVFRFSLTPTPARNRMISRFRLLRRDSPPLDQGAFLFQLSSPFSAKKGVGPPPAFFHSPR